MNLFFLLCALAEIPVYFLIIVLGGKRAYERGLKEGYQRGFTDAQVFSELWWQVAENEVDQARVKIWKEESRWP